MKHKCHATECNVSVPPSMLMCKKHWFMLPIKLRNQIWAAYVPGQEIRKDPSDAYMKIYHKCIAFIEAKEGVNGPQEIAPAPEERK